jgi:Ser/Thr protein kinase RdoA (MazF antagonist)
MHAVTARVLAAYPPLHGRLEALGNHGGFSGARLWRMDTIAGLLGLRACAPAERPEAIRQRHHLMQVARSAGLPFVPTVLRTVVGDTFVEAEGRYWELMEWLPGKADFRTSPSPARLQAAVHAVARIHLAWEPFARGMATPCPAVIRRLQAVESLPSRSPGTEFLVRLQETVARWLPLVPTMLEQAHLSCRLQPCLRDVWHDHLLFTGSRLTGLVDYASVGLDSVAVDLARMLGSLLEDDEPRWQMAIDAYREVRALSSAEVHLARILDRTGAIVTLANWLGRLIDLDRRGQAHGDVEKHVTRYLERVERWC